MIRRAVRLELKEVNQYTGGGGDVCRIFWKH